MTAKRICVGTAALLAVAACAASPAISARLTKHDVPDMAEAVALEPAASYVAEHSVRVFCSATAADFQAFMSGENAPPKVIAWTPKAPGVTTFLAHKVCVPLLLGLRSRPVDGQQFAWSIEVLTHESLHLRGWQDEGATDCEAMHAMPRVAVKFFHVKPGKQLRALMALQWETHYRMPPAYQTVC